MAVDNGFQLLGADGIPSSSKRSVPVKCALAAAVIGSLTLLATFRSGSLATNSSTELLGFFGAAPQLRATPVSAADQMLRYGIKPSPLSQLAVAAIEMNNLANHQRDVSVRAMEEAKEKVAKEVSNLDDTSKAKLEEVSKAVELKAKDMVGITAPMGFFDPIGLSVNEEAGKLLFYRECELKHGRVAMLASLGLLVGEKFHPLFGGNIDVPSYIAFQATPLQRLWPAVVTAVAIPEIFSIFQFDFIPGSNPKNPEGGAWWSIKPSKRIPGDFGFDPLGLRPQTPDELKEMQNKEINNGRLAMIAAAGMIAQELATGQKLF
eukprot:gnl/TRDRNA2_/TRDRNA2_177387_c0_seq6.p1 gnl/TRDRNA2_/TRDRNA2_177387_c0~~gnl/TRDRNA2_/TRDRNA2_177387_c0_seq6.p1  ORF type:complete len:320 (+),score=84.89 gnl/TRDRNA2_/TRDRNA2_177387_c0_seq6:66-1025(+)